MQRVFADFQLSNTQYNYFSIPNAVDVSKFNYDTVKIDAELEKYKDCILCVSRIEGRKNQLNIIRACKNLPYKFVFVGKASVNFKKYYDKCKNEASENMYFIGQIEHEKLPPLYKLAKVHILASWMETPGLSSLEAAIMRVNIVVTKKGDTEDYFKNYAFYCEPNDTDSIQKAVVAAYNASFDENLHKLIMNSYKWEDTARKTLNAYLSVYNEK
jgi:glycosyltransferase involved in cell wall biosynthesis